MASDNSESDEKATKVNCGINSLTDEDIFKACGGRTAHKGARHGLKLSGKLARLEEQEALLTGLKNIHIGKTNDVIYVNYRSFTKLKRLDDKHRTLKSKTIAPNQVETLSKKKQTDNEKMKSDLELKLQLNKTENNENAESKCKLSLSESHRKVQNSNEQDMTNEIDLSKNSFRKIREQTISSKRSKSIQPNSAAAIAKKNIDEWMLNEESVLVYRHKRKREEDDDDNVFKDRIKRQYWSVFDIDMYKIQINTLKEKVKNFKNKREKVLKKVDKYDSLLNTKPDNDSVLKKAKRRQKKYKTRYEEVCQELKACKNELKMTRRGLKVTNARLNDEKEFEDVLETISNISVTDESNQG